MIRMATDPGNRHSSWRYWARIGAVAVAASMAVMLGFSGVTWRTPWRQVAEAFRSAVGAKPEKTRLATLLV